MCCFFAALLFFGPRLGFLVYWLLAPARVNLALANFQLPLAGRSAGTDLPAVDHANVLHRLPIEWI